MYTFKAVHVLMILDTSTSLRGAMVLEGERSANQMAPMYDGQMEDGDIGNTAMDTNTRGGRRLKSEGSK